MEINYEMTKSLLVCIKKTQRKNTDKWSLNKYFTGFRTISFTLRLCFGETVYPKSGNHTYVIFHSKWCILTIFIKKIKTFIAFINKLNNMLIPTQ